MKFIQAEFLEQDGQLVLKIQTHQNTAQHQLVGLASDPKEASHQA